MAKYLVLILLFFGCVREKEAKEFPRTEQLLSYLEAKGSKPANGSFIVIIISGGCGSCTSETVHLLKQIEADGKFAHYEKYVLVSADNINLQDSLRHAKSKLIVDKQFDMNKFGLNFSDNSVLRFDDGEISFWSWITTNTIREIEVLMKLKGI